MARVTIADCLKYVDNRFELVRIAAKRARQLARGGMALVPVNNDKPTVLALREIASGQQHYLEHQLDLTKTETSTVEVID